MHFLVNTPRLTRWGVYSYGPISTEDAKRWIRDDTFTSAIGHQTACNFLTNILGVQVPYNRIETKMEVGDEALVLRLNARLPEGKTNLTVDEMKSLPFDLALIRRVQ